MCFGNDTKPNPAVAPAGTSYNSGPGSQGVSGGNSGGGGRPVNGTAPDVGGTPGSGNPTVAAGGGGGQAPGTGTTPATVATTGVAKQVEDAEAARQAAIRAGNANIDAAFGQFNDPYYTAFEDAYKNYYNPQVDSQYHEADGTMEAGLARNGIDRSSIAATKHGQLFGAYGDQRAAIGDAAHSGAQELRGKVANEKSSLYAENSASADPAQASNEALARSTALVTPPAFSPLGQLFGNFLQPFTQYASSYSNNAGKPYVSPFGAA